MTLEHVHSALKRFLSREPVFGAAQAMASSTVTELALWSGYDFIMLDCEHGWADESSHLTSLQVISASAAFALVRVRAGDYGAVGRYLDHGADGILLADVKTAAEAATLVAAATFGPAGTRSSSAGTRHRRYGLQGQSAASQPLLFAMIEGREAVANADAIAATPGLHGLVVGPNDLSADLGCYREFESSRYVTALEEVERIAMKNGRFLGTSNHPNFPADKLITRGHTLILISSDIAALRDGYGSHLAKAREQRDKAARP